MNDWPPGGRYWVVLAQNDDHMMVGNDLGETRVITQALAVEMFDLQMLPTGHLVRVPDNAGAVLIPRGDDMGFYTDRYELATISDANSGLTARAVFVPNFHRQAPPGVWFVETPAELFAHHTT